LHTGQAFLLGPSAFADAWARAPAEILVPLPKCRGSCL
jgi:hypothetical protein